MKVKKKHLVCAYTNQHAIVICVDKELQHIQPIKTFHFKLPFCKAAMASLPLKVRQ